MSSTTLQPLLKTHISPFAWVGYKRKIISATFHNSISEKRYG